MLSNKSRYEGGVSSLGVPGVPWTSYLNQGEADYAHQIILAPPDIQTFLRPCDNKYVVEIAVIINFSVLVHYTTEDFPSVLGTRTSVYA